jgi:cytochrome c oxidase subunit 1
MELGGTGNLIFAGNFQLIQCYCYWSCFCYDFFYGNAALIGGFGNWMVPLMIGAPDMAFQG